MVGNRPQFVKAAAVSTHLRERADEILVHTGQHYDPELSDVFFEELELPRARPRARGRLRQPRRADRGDPDPSRAAGARARARRAARLRRHELHPGRRAGRGQGVRSRSSTSRPACARATGRCPRRSTGSWSTRLGGLLLCSTETAIENLAREGLGDGAVVTGDVMADVALALRAGRRRALRRARAPRAGARSGYQRRHRAPGRQTSTTPSALALVIEVLARAAEARHRSSSRSTRGPGPGWRRSGRWSALERARHHARSSRSATST